MIILVAFAFVLFAVAAIWNPPPPNPWFGRFVAAGLMLWSLYVLLVNWHWH